MKTLIVYYSFTRNNEMLAKALQQRLECDIHKIEEVKPRKNISIFLDLLFNREPTIRPTPCLVSLYDQCIFVAPIWAGKIASPLKAFLKEEKYHINRYSFITVCGGNAGQKEKLVKSLTQLLEQPPGAVQELWINDLLPKDKKNTIKYTSGYRLQSGDLKKFDPAIDKFVSGLADLEKIPVS